MKTSNILTTLTIILLLITPIGYADKRESNIDYETVLNNLKNDINSFSPSIGVPNLQFTKQEPIATESSVSTLSGGNTGSGQGYRDYSSQGPQPLISAHANLFSGGVGYTYNFEVPVGINGVQPDVLLSYSHYSANSLSSLGSGWNINTYSIMRDTNHTQSDTSDDSFRINLNNILGPLIYSDGYYHTKHESYARIKKLSGASNEKGEYWEVHTKDGTKYTFGNTLDSEQVSNLENFVSIWHLKEIEDTHGNKITYTYLENPYSGEGVTYLSEINYGLNKIKITYKENTVTNRLYYSSANKIKPSAIFSELNTYHNNTWIRRYIAGIFTKEVQSMMFLGLIGESYKNYALPNTYFGYYDSEKGWAEDASFTMPPEVRFVKDGWKDAGVRIIDIDNDGLQDILKMYSSSDIKVWRNTGNGWSPVENWNSFLDGGFVGTDGIDNGVRFGDINGDLRPDIVKAKGGTRLTKTNTVSKKDFNWADSNMQLPSGINFVTDTGTLLGYNDCTPSACPSGYSDLGVSCDGEYCTRTCSSEACGSTWTKVWDDTQGAAVSNDDRVTAYSYYYHFCGRLVDWGGFSCDEPQTYCYQMYHAGCGKEASSDIKSQTAMLYSNFGSIDGKCEDNEYDESDWRCDISGYSYCLPRSFSCNGIDNCRNTCWEEGPNGVQYTDFTLKAWDGDCDDSSADLENGHQEAAAVIEVYTSPVTGNIITQTCEREAIYELPIDEGVRLIDVDGDSDSDIVIATDTTRTTYLNQRDSWQISTDWQIPSAMTFIDNSGNDKNVRTVDINGDGLIDLVKADTGSKVIWLNTGKGWTSSTITLPDFTFTSNNQDNGIRFGEVNGDGLIDIVQKTSTTINIWINYGFEFDLDNTYNIPSSIDLSVSGVRTVDINGDGLMDFVSGNGTQKTWINKAQKQYLLRNTTSTFGGVTSFDYQLTALVDNTDDNDMSNLGFGGWIIKNMTQFDGIDQYSTTSYTFTGGHYDASEYDFRGFNIVKEIGKDGRYTEHYYHQDEARSSIEYETTVYDSANYPYKKIIYDWSSIKNNNIFTVQLDSITEYDYEGWHD